MIDILLDISIPTANPFILLLDSKATGRRVRIPQDSLMVTDQSGNLVFKKRILLESWQLALSYVVIFKYLVLMSQESKQNCQLFISVV